MNPDSLSLIGRQLGAYRVVSLLGKGGMGEVYRAHDARLGRDVAIKILPTQLAADPERLARFETEARILATLNHQHIAAIYGFEEFDGTHGIVLELVEGPTLADLIATGATSGSTGPRRVEDALVIARQIADALEAAHAKGIIHRDLKPANIKVTTGNIVKVLDFGLAKATTSGTELSQVSTMTALHTREGVVVGTAAYMSPEQARGHPLDRRTDVWAFGCVLFEMLVGRAPFTGATVSDTLARVLEREPGWSSLPSATPARVRALLRRCLQKDPAKRLATLAEARQDIEATLASPFKLPRAMAESVRWHLSRPFARATLAVIALALVGVALYRSRDDGQPVPQLANPVQVTSAVGVEDHPTLSPDYRTVVYESNESGNWDVWLAPVGGGQAVNRTADHVGFDRYPSWSPDGRQIAFWSDRDGGGYFVMPALGGTPTRVVSTPGTGDFFHSPPAWSPDGMELVCVNYTLAEGRHEVFAEIVSLVTRETRRFELPGIEQARLDVDWSADGRYLAYVDGGTQAAETADLRILRLSDRQTSVIPGKGLNFRHPKWSPDGQYLFYIANRSGPADLWRQRIVEGESVLGMPERVTTGLELRDAVLSSDGMKIAYSKGRLVSNVWRVPIFEDRPATWTDATQMTFDQAFIEFVDISRDGRLLAYSSDRTGNQDVWIMPIGGEARQLTADPAPDWSPRWSPNSQQLAFYSYRTGDREIWVMPAAGGAATQLTQSKGLDAVPEWSPNGQEVAFRSERTGDSEIWVMRPDGSGLRQLTHHPAADYVGTWSPDGHWLAFTSNRGDTRQIWRVPAQGGEPDLLVADPAVAVRWSPDERIYFGTGDKTGVNHFWSFSVADRRRRAVTHLVGRRGTLGVYQPPATDGKFLYFTWGDDLGDIWVMDIVQE